MEIKAIDQIIEEAINSGNEYETINIIVREYIQSCLDQEDHYEDKIYNKGLGYARATGGLTALITFAIQKAIYYKKLNDELLCTSRNS